MMRLLHFCIAVVVTIGVIAMHTPTALADSFSAVDSVEVPGCSSNATLSAPGSIDVSCSAALASGTIFGTLGWSSGDIHYFVNPFVIEPLINGMVSGTVSIAREIMAPGNSGTSTYSFEFQGSESQNTPIGCHLTFDGVITACSPSGFSFGQMWTEDLEFVVPNGQSYDFDLEIAFQAPVLSGIPIDANFQYSLFGTPEPVPEPASLVLLLSGFAPLVFSRKHSR